MILLRQSNKIRFEGNWTRKSSPHHQLSCGSLGPTCTGQWCFNNVELGWLDGSKGEASGNQRLRPYPERQSQLAHVIVIKMARWTRAMTNNINAQILHLLAMNKVFKRVVNGHKEWTRKAQMHLVHQLLKLNTVMGLGRVKQRMNR